MVPLQLPDDAALSDCLLRKRAKRRTCGVVLDNIGRELLPRLVAAVPERQIAPGTNRASNIPTSSNTDRRTDRRHVGAYRLRSTSNRTGKSV